MNDPTIKKLLDSLKNEIVKIENTQEQAEALLRLSELASAYEGEDKVISSKDIAKELIDNPRPNGTMLGFPELDKIISGFTPQQVIVLAGVTKHGKTSWAVDLTIRLEKDNPLWLPFEESAQELIQKFLWRNQEPPLFFTPQRMKQDTLDWIEAKIVESKAKYDTKIVFIDHLGFITPRSDNEAQEIGRVMRHLKNLAKKWNIIIFLLAHLTKTQIDRHPNLEDLRGSAAIGQEADTVIFIWRETIKHRKTGEIEITNLTNISVQANRRTGRTGNVKMMFDKGRFYETDWEQIEVMKKQGEIIPDNNW